MGVADLKDRLRKVVGIHTLKVQPGAIVINNQTIPIGPAATDDEIAAAIQNNIDKINQITAKPMSISGYQPGAIKDRLAALKQKANDARSQALAKIDAAGKKHDEVNAQIETVAKQIEKEADDALHEFAEFTNGAPV